MLFERRLRDDFPGFWTAPFPYADPPFSLTLSMNLSLLVSYPLPQHALAPFRGGGYTFRHYDGIIGYDS